MGGEYQFAIARIFKELDGIKDRLNIIEMRQQGLIVPNPHHIDHSMNKVYCQYLGKDPSVEEIVRYNDDSTTRND